MKTSRLFSTLLVIALVLGMIMPASADDKYLKDHFSYIITGPVDYSGKTVILHSNDVHGALEGYACMATLRKEYEDLGAEVFVVDAGDFLQGNAYVNMSNGHSAIDMMNAAGYDLATLGNHEFDYGYDVLKADLADAKFPLLCANVFDEATGEPILPATHILETDSGLRIGFFGLDTPETASKTNPRKLDGVTFSMDGKLYECAQSAIEDLTDSDVVIGLVHLGMDEESGLNGYRSLDLLNNVTGVDFLIDGHSHTVMTEGPNGEPIQSTGTMFGYIGVIVIDDATGKIEDHYLRDVSQIKKDEAVNAAATEIISEVEAIYGAVFATTEIKLNGERDPGVRTKSTNLGELVADALLWCATEDGRIDPEKAKGVIAILNGGTIRTSIDAGDITMNDIKKMMPFDNTVNVVYVTGGELLEALEASTFCTPEALGGYPQTSGIVWTLDTTVPFEPGDHYVLNGKESVYCAPAAIRRVSITSIGGEPFDPEATYAVITIDFCAAGGDTYNVFSRAYAAGDCFDIGVASDEAVIAYITEALNGVITAEAYGELSGDQTQILPAA